MNLLHALKEYGLTENEAKIYLFLLEQVESSIYEIAKGISVPRTTVYATIETMIKSGLLQSFKKNNVLYITPANPTQLIQQLEEKRKIVDEILPELKALAETSDIKPVVKLYTGREGLITVFEDILETLEKKKLKHLYAATDLDVIEYLADYFPNWLTRRVGLGVFTNMIIPESAKSQKAYYAGSFREARFLPGKFGFEVSMDIYGDKIAFFSLKGGNIYSVIIESPTISKMFLQFFNFTWECLPVGMKSE